MKKEIIKLTVLTWNADTRKHDTPLVIEGHRVTLPGFEDFTFIMHRQIGRANKWTVTEETTGYKLLSDDGGGNTQAQAMANVRARFDRFKVTPASFAKLIKTVKRGQK